MARLSGSYSHALIVAMHNLCLIRDLLIWILSERLEDRMTISFVSDLDTKGEYKRLLISDHRPDACGMKFVTGKLSPHHRFVKTAGIP